MEQKEHERKQEIEVEAVNELDREEEEQELKEHEKKEEIEKLAPGVVVITKPKKSKSRATNGGTYNPLCNAIFALPGSKHKAIMEL